MPTIQHHHRWGNWQFDERKLYLDYVPHGYNIPLQTTNLFGQILNSVRSIKTKSWGTQSELLDLLSAYRDVFHSNARFKQSFDQEITQKHIRWLAALNEVATLIRTGPSGQGEWQQCLEVIRSDFDAGRISQA
jgi:hypothetical protein